MYKCLHGTCSYSPNQGIQCLCDPGFKGARCDVKDPCSPDPCEGALCVEVDPEAPEPKHTCICRLDQEVDSNSMKCETPHHSICRDKAGNPVCLHDGHCYPCALDSEVLNLCSDIETKRGFRCICAPGFLPPFCAKHTDACSFHRCLNGGQCRSMNNSKVDYTCHCKLGFSGNFCEKPMGVCISRGFASCVHGKCQESNSSARGFICECDSGFYGFDCQFEKELAIFEKIDARILFCQLSWSLGADFAATHFCCSSNPEKTTNIERPRRGSGNGICQRPQRIRRSD
uniref:EGF-like domain-containing protein n=1 Tax=Panagrolaimus sp. JU765 TaxID=591449 RepID=A0AC34QV53_9BILA